MTPSLVRCSRAVTASTLIPLMVRRLATATCLAAIALPLVLPAVAGANAYTEVYAEFQKVGSVPACKFTAATLKAAQGETPSYDQQYFADFSDAVTNALNAQVGGVCAGGKQSSVLGGTAPALNGTGGGPLPKSTSASTSSNVPLAFVLLGVLVGLLAIGGAVFAVVWRRGIESPWMADWRHACQEASFRLEGRWAEHTDRRRRRRARKRMA